MYEESLKQYVNEDIVYKRYKSGETGFNDYEKFCIKHCKDIESLLEQNRILKSQLDFIDEQNKYIEKLEKRIDKAIEIAKEKIKRYESYINDLKNGNYPSPIIRQARQELIFRIREQEELLKILKGGNNE